MWCSGQEYSWNLFSCQELETLGLWEWRSDNCQRAWSRCPWGKEGFAAGCLSQGWTPHVVIHNQHPQEWGSLCFCFLRSLNKHCSGTCLFSSYQHQKPIFISSNILSPAQCWQLFSHPLPALEIPAAVMGSSCKLFNWKEFLSGLKMSGGWRRRVYKMRLDLQCNRQRLDHWESFTLAGFIQLLEAGGR